MNYRNVIAILLLLAVSAIAEDGVTPLRVLSISVTTTEYHLYATPLTNEARLSGIKVNPTNHFILHYYPGAQLLGGQTVESVDIETRTVKMTDGDTTAFPSGKITRTNIAVVSLSTGEILWGTPGSTLSDQITIIEVKENGGIIAETPVDGRVTIPKATVPELQELGKQKPQQSGPAYPPQGVGSADP